MLSAGLLATLPLIALASWAATAAVLRLLLAWQVFDEPNERSSHHVATPRGGGLAVVAVVLLAWVGGALWLHPVATGFWAVLGGMTFLAAVSWLDDLRSLPAGLRFAVQAAAVLTALWASGDGALVFAGFLPPLLDTLLVALLWLWFINLFNFMDGIDGIAAIECLCVAGGLALCAALGNPGGSLGGDLVFWSAGLAAAALGFLPWNWAPARIFLGDVGSIPLGYLLGWLLILLAAGGSGAEAGGGETGGRGAGAAGGAWAAALILPLYYLTDASWTLFRRLLRGEAPWKSHREHLYQQAVQRGFSHAAVTTRVLVCNAFLVVFAVLAIQGEPWPALGLACIAVGVLVFMLARLEPPARESAREP